MDYKAWYRKYRPNTFAQIVSQDDTIKILKNSILNNSFNHAYLFSGSKGTGKTSTAKIFAKAINCQNNIKGDACNKCEICRDIVANANAIDILEIDGASHNGVDQIRSIIENVNLLPMSFKYKIYIIDEVHMLTSSAFNALLKTLEEPPQHIIFILATTEPYKVPATIISRCQWFEFHKINHEETKKQFIKILNQEKITFEIDAINEIALLSDGSLRDGLNHLEKIFNYSENITLLNVEKVFSISAVKNKILFLTNIFNCNMQQVIEQLTIFDQYTINYQKLLIEFIYLLEDIMIYRMTHKEHLLKLITIAQVQIFAQITKNDLFLVLNTFNDVLNSENIDDLKPILILKILNLTNDFTNKYDPLLLEEAKKNPSNNAPTVMAISTKTNEDPKIEIATIDNAPNFSNTTLISTTKHQNQENKIEKPITKTLTIENDKNNAIIDHAINIILQADKSIRKEINEKWKKLNDFIKDNKFRNLTKIYLNTLVSAASKNGIIIITENIIQADLINKRFLSQEHRTFLNFLLNQAYMIYALDKSQWKETRKKYQQLASDNNLPMPVDISIPDVIIESFDNLSMDPTLNFIKKIFSEVEEI